MKIAPFLLAAGLLLTTAVGGAYADSLVLFDGAQFDFSGTWIVTAGTHIGQTGSLAGSFTLGSMVNTTEWSVMALSAGGIDAPLGTFTLSSGFVFDGSNDTLVGTATSPTFLGSGGDTRQVVAHFLDGNTTTNTFNNMTSPTRPIADRARLVMASQRRRNQLAFCSSASALVAWPRCGGGGTPNNGFRQRTVGIQEGRLPHGEGPSFVCL